MKSTRLICFILLVACVCWTGCEKAASHTNPIADWKAPLVSRDYDFLNNQSVKDDIDAYIRALPSGERDGDLILFSADGTGQHAAMIKIIQNGTVWGHVLIYDKENKRTKVVKYIIENYAS